MENDNYLHPGKFMFRRCLAILGAVVILAACSDGTGPSAATCSGNAGPPWPGTVSGCWVEPGVDTYTDFDLVQQGTSINGTATHCGVAFGPSAHCYDSEGVTGTILSSHVRLQWDGGALEATLVPTGDTLVSDTTAAGVGVSTRLLRLKWR